eukprot:gnl/Spiro4/26038_TR12975_c0_g1_i1.p2 gnl/Spiro4/26038_TR12975_c0_g1~~gnl/Spiro4/26038_TR12975_c0_g1_i1.p2  ORF type:complete len:170 (+),score=40.12 gnl/Spiro4/26038_TR12975_c0_g1_i1:44-553(+)
MRPKVARLAGRRARLVPYEREHVSTYHLWMTDPELRALTESDPLTLEQEYNMREDWETATDKCTFILYDITTLSVSTTTSTATGTPTTTATTPSTTNTTTTITTTTTTAPISTTTTTASTSTTTTTGDLHGGSGCNSSAVSVSDPDPDSDSDNSIDSARFPAVHLRTKK